VAISCYKFGKIILPVIAVADSRDSYGWEDTKISHVSTSKLGPHSRSSCAMNWPG